MVNSDALPHACPTRTNHRNHARGSDHETPNQQNIDRRRHRAGMEFECLRRLHEGPGIRDMGNRFLERQLVSSENQRTGRRLRGVRYPVGVPLNESTARAADRLHRARFAGDEFAGAARPRGKSPRDRRCGHR